MRGLVELLNDLNEGGAFSRLTGATLKFGTEGLIILGISVVAGLPTYYAIGWMIADLLGEPIAELAALGAIVKFTAGRFSCIFSGEEGY